MLLFPILGPVVLKAAPKPRDPTSGAKNCRLWEESSGRGPGTHTTPNLARLPLALGSLTQVGRRVGLGGSRPQRASPINDVPAAASLPPSGPSPKGGRGTRASGLADSQWLLAPSSPTPWTGGRPAPQRPRAVLTNLATASHAWLLMDQVR